MPRLAVCLALAAVAAAVGPDAAPSPAHAGHAGHAAAPGAAPGAVPNDPCFADPGAAACAAYERPAGAWERDVRALCAAMDYMPGCTLWRECQAASSTSSYCAPASLTATLCADMPKMKACAAHNALCAAGSTVPACATPGALPSAPSTAAAEAAVRTMCSSHGMPGCDACTGAAGSASCRDPLAALATVCASMPGMADCAPLATACGTEGAAALFPKTCALVGGGGGSGSGHTHAAHSSPTAAAARSIATDYTLPPMRMWLHGDATDAVLSRHWVPRTPGSVAAACLGTIAAAVATQALRAARALLEAHWAAGLRAGTAAPSSGARVARNAVRAAATFAVSLLDLLLMLIAMTFSWPLILSVAGGYAVGTLLLGHVGERGAPGGPPLAGGKTCNGSASNGGASTNGVTLIKGSPVLGAGGCCDLSGGVGQGVKPGV